MSCETPSPFPHKWEEPKTFHKLLKSVVQWEALQNVGDGAGRPWKPVLMQVYVQKFGLPGTYLSCAGTLCWSYSQVTCGVCCCFTFPSSVNSALAKDSAVVRVWALFLNLKSVCRGIACSSTSLSQDAYMHSPKRVWRHNLSVSQAEPWDGKALCALQQCEHFLALSWCFPLPRCWTLLTENEQGGVWGLAGLTLPEQPPAATQSCF